MELPDAAWRSAFRRRLRAWFARHARDLPWRRTRDPYAIWISEIMLQQTQVATVKPYFERFLRAFPTIESLARADLRDVLRQWEGLGYYRRARQLHQAARVLVERHGGTFPRDAEAVRRLPGIGRYTAGAILSIAFDARLPILEANTLRLFSRLLAWRGNPASAAGNRLLWAMAQAVLPKRGCGGFNQALMELGSMVCTARAPECGRCPVAALCRAAALGLQAEIPPPKAKPPVEQRHEAAVIVRRGDRVLLVERPDFPRVALEAQGDAAIRAELTDAVRRQTGVTVDLGRLLVTLRHGVTRFRITLDCYEARHVAGRARDGRTMRWVTARDLREYPLCTTGRRLSRLVAPDLESERGSPREK
ncbi:MAG: A/G-specific adenine glycosylase [Thermoguttaceae bacterium]|nr:A/G-specific adenine glycosylase [Thermoguttaceae bacterium]